MLFHWSVFVYFAPVVVLSVYRHQGPFRVLSPYRRDFRSYCLDRFCDCSASSKLSAHIGQLHSISACHPLQDPFSCSALSRGDAAVQLADYGSDRLLPILEANVTHILLSRRSPSLA